jgi:hypothetical protein
MRAMTRRLRIISRLAALVLLAPAAAAGAPGAAPAPAPAPAPTLAGFDFRRDTDARFSADLQRGIAALAAAKTRAELQLARMDLAELYLAHLMLPEGRSLLDAVAQDHLDAAGKARWGALSAAVTLMAGKPLAKDAEASPLAAGNAGWPDYDFWSAMQAIRAQDAEGVRAHLAGAFKRLAAYPPVYGTACLPLFLAAAIDTRQWELAQKIAVGFDAYPALKARPVYKYLLGRAALGVKRPQQAHAALREAAAGSGPFAQRAVQALVDLGLQDHSLTPEKAQKMLEASLAEWSGGEIALGALRRLARVDRQLGDWPGLLQVLGRITRDHPKSPDAPPARRQADSLIAGYYPFAISGKVPLAQLLAVHRAITPYFRFDEVFETQAAALADHLLALGATAMAAEEYRRIHDTLEVVKDLGLWKVAPERLADLKLREAAALAQGGQMQAAAKALAAVDQPSAKARDRVATLRAEVYAALGDQAKVLATSVAEPGPVYLRLVAAAHFDRKDWAGAEANLRRLWRAHPKDFAGADAIRLLIAAHRAGDRAVAEKVAAAFPKLGDSPAWSRLASGLVRAPAPLSPLKLSAADARLKSAQGLIDRIGQAAAAIGGAAKK